MHVIKDVAAAEEASRKALSKEDPPASL